MYNGSGPWVLPGDGTSKDIEWRKAMSKGKEDDKPTVSCGVSRLIGSLPPEVYAGSSLTFTWGEIDGFVDVKSGTNYKVQTGYKIFDDNSTLVAEADGAAFNVMWEDSNSFATGLTAAVAATYIFLAQLF